MDSEELPHSDDGGSDDSTDSDASSVLFEIPPLTSTQKKIPAVCNLKVLKYFLFLVLCQGLGNWWRLNVRFFSTIVIFFYKTLSILFK